MSQATVTETNPLQKLLKGKPEDWADAIGKAIEETEAEIGRLKGAIAAQREACKQLKALRGAVAPEVKPPKTTTASRRPRGGASKSDKRTVIFDFLQRVGDPVKPAAIASELDLHHKTVYSLLNHEWFEKTPDGYTVAAAK